MSINGLAYVMIGACDLERSLDFYRDVLGLTISGRFGEFAFIDTGNTALVVTSELARARGAEREGCEVVFSVDSVTETYNTLKDRVAFVNEPRPVNPQQWAVNFCDPDGHSLSFYGPQ